jgi:hypothetical protein
MDAALDKRPGVSTTKAAVGAGDEGDGTFDLQGDSFMERSFQDGEGVSWNERSNLSRDQR